MTPLEAHLAKIRAFRANPAIAQLADIPRWTISTNEKMPIDMYRLRYFGDVAGCNIETPHSTCTLDELLEVVPAPANAAFYLDNAVDLVNGAQICVLDIEPECDERLKQQLVTLPAFYRERSMSGHGYHLLCALPEDIFDEYPIAANKKALKDKARGYEVLMEHWVTFTFDQLAEPAYPLDASEFRNLFGALAAKAREATYTDVDITLDEPAPESIPYYGNLLRAADTFVKQHKRSPQDFDGDMSRYEFSVLTGLLKGVRRRQEYLRSQQDPGVVLSWDDNQTAWVVYRAAIDELEHRPKHDQIRNGMPMLMYSIRNALARESLADKQMAQDVTDEGGTDNA